MRKRAAAGLCLLAAVPLAHSQESEQMPDLELLEYLGSWQEGDEDWLVVAEWQKRERRSRREPPEENADDEEE